jgi:acetyltransferase-like isoleucine patch superfamily enzyme
LSRLGQLRYDLRRGREAIWARIRLRGCTEIGSLTRLNGGVILSNRGTLRLGDRVKLNGTPVPIELVALAGAELTIGAGTSINRGVSICAQRSIRIGSHCGIGNDVLIFDTDFHDVSDRGRVPDASPVSIGDNVWLAARSIVLKGVTIGDGAVVCAGSVVATNVAPYTMVGGSPARVIRRLERPGEAAAAPSPAATSRPASAQPIEA